MKNNVHARAQLIETCAHTCNNMEIGLLNIRRRSYSQQEQQASSFVLSQHTSLITSEEERTAITPFDLLHGLGT